MVTKLFLSFLLTILCSVLAKIHMVTKHTHEIYFGTASSVLAKIHMVTKLET